MAEAEVKRSKFENEITAVEDAAKKVVSSVGGNQGKGKRKVANKQSNAGSATKQSVSGVKPDSASYSATSGVSLDSPKPKNTCVSESQNTADGRVTTQMKKSTANTSDTESILKILQTIQTNQKSQDDKIAKMNSKVDELYNYGYEYSEYDESEVDNASVCQGNDFPGLKLIEIVILWVYYTIPFGYSFFRQFLVITFQLFILHVWLRITDECSVPEMRIWSISLI